MSGARDFLRDSYLVTRAALLAPLALRRRRASPPTELRRVLVLRLDRIGDLVLSTPFLGNLRTFYPTARIVLAARPFAAELLSATGLVDEIVPLEPGREVETAAALAGEPFDLGIDMHCDYILRPALVLRRVRARFTVGFDIGGRGHLFDLAVRPGRKKHFVQESFDLLRALGLRPETCPPEISLRPEQHRAADALLARSGVRGPYAVFHPGGFYAAQRWPGPRFAELADRTVALGLAPLLLGDAGDARLLREVTGKMRTRPVVICGEGLGVCGAVMSRAALFVGNNSGPLHLACALGLPSVSTMGPTDPVRFWPVSDRASVVRAATVQEIPVERMFSAVKTALAGQGMAEPAGKR
ncbi:MAG: glycosyltransferase family 9 protein [candidate division NC10 bacterium]|nr:glycosyltransferase family 9 protein [candidate division NC10 bacterium]